MHCLTELLYILCVLLVELMLSAHVSSCSMSILALLSSVDDGYPNADVIARVDLGIELTYHLTM